MTTAKAKLSFLSMALGSLFMATLTAGSALAGPIDWAKCKYCNARSKKCATDEKFFDSCMVKCPESKKSDPIKKCRTAHFNAMKANKPEETPPTMNELISGNCQQKLALIDMHNVVSAKYGKTPYTKEEKEYILGGCNKQGSSASAPAATHVPPPSDAPPVRPSEAARLSQLARPLPARPEEPSELTPLQRQIEAKRQSLRKSGGPVPAAPSVEESPYQAMPAPRKSQAVLPPPPPPVAPAVAPAGVQPQQGRGALLGQIQADNPLDRLRPTKKPATAEESTTYTLSAEDKKFLDRRYGVDPESLEESISDGLRKAQVENNKTDIAKYTAQLEWFKKKEEW